MLGVIVAVVTSTENMEEVTRTHLIQEATRSKSVAMRLFVHATVRQQPPADVPLQRLGESQLGRTQTGRSRLSCEGS